MQLPGGVRKFIFLFFVMIPLFASPQDRMSKVDSLYAELDELFANDSLPGDLFRLADSLLTMEKGKISAVNARIGYVSEIQTAGRTFGINQYGFTGSINYFHWSGLNAGVTGYSNSVYTPSYYMTDAYVGYMYSYKQKITAQINHDFYIYNDTISNHPFTKSIQASVNYQTKYGDAGLDYGYLYGNSDASRITGHVNARLKFKFKKTIDVLTIMPGCSFQWGNADIFYWRQPRAALVDLYKIIKNNNYPLLARGEYLKLAYLLENQRENAARFFLRERDYSADQITSLFDLYYGGSVKVQNAFGFMNWNVSLPILIRKGRFTLLLNYTYNIPQPLPGETTSYPSSGYFSSSLSYMFSWLKK